jgi:hypothetical protein
MMQIILVSESGSSSGMAIITSIGIPVFGECWNYVKLTHPETTLALRVKKQKGGKANV